MEVKLDQKTQETLLKELESLKAEIVSLNETLKELSRNVSTLAITVGRVM